MYLLASIVILHGTLAIAADTPRAVAANDNRSPAGELRNGVLTIHLELGEGLWHQGSEDGEAIPVYAFGEAGRTLQNPGPLIRVPQGTEIQGTILNALPKAVRLHGLHERPGEEKDAFTVQPGATQQFRFTAGTPGTYFYWGTTTGSTIAQREAIETQLAGAFVIDPPGAAAKDRIFVIGVWAKELLPPDIEPNLAEIATINPEMEPDLAEIVTINGKSWPHTERFTFRAGETVRWRWVNPSTSDHAMHLYGFYYRLDAVGDGERNQVFDEAARPLVVTKHVARGGSFDMTWVPERSGRWLFHCHMLGHMSPPEPPLGPSSAAVSVHTHGADSVASGMGGLVLGITVLADKSDLQPAAWHAERKLQLIIDERKGGRPLYALQLRDTTQPPSPSQKQPAPRLIGPPIVLTRGQPVEIEVVNHIKQPTSIHWHGIELESYYDGVAGWTGAGQQTTPAIKPGESFVVRMAPPRAGTFIYHTHWHERSQLENGIYGPLIVLPPGQKLDPNYDRTFVFSVGEFEPFGSMLLVNGNPQPSPLRLKTGTRYRFRLINITPDNPGMRVSLRKSGVPVQWRIIAKDGADLPPAAAPVTTAEMGITVGETYDAEYQASAPEELALEVYLPFPKVRTTQALVFTSERPRN